MKRILVLMIISLFMMNSVSFAAIGGSKIKLSSPKISSSQKSFSTKSEKSDYKPSASANSYKDKAPEASAKSNINTGVGQNSNTGSFMRNLGMIAGGMMFGSMLSHMFGLGGSGFFDLFFGVLANVVLFGGTIMIINFIWRKIRRKISN